MKKTVLLLAAGLVLLLSSCEVTKEISIQNDGSGSFSSTTDMSGVMGMVKMSMDAQMKNLQDSLGDNKDLDLGRAVDTTVSMALLADSIPELSAEERDLVRKAMLGLNIDMKNEKFITKLQMPFKNTSEISKMDKLSSRVIPQILKKEMNKSGEKMPSELGGLGGLGGGEMPEGSIDDYFVISYAKGLIEKKLIPDKYANKDADEGLKALQQMSSMGMGNTKTIYNLPRPVKKTTGKGITVSEDKKTVTIMTTAEDFFDDAKGMEFKIEY
jgi:hypothetical protein